MGRAPPRTGIKLLNYRLRVRFPENSRTIQKIRKHVNQPSDFKLLVTHDLIRSFRDLCYRDSLLLSVSFLIAKQFKKSQTHHLSEMMSEMMIRNLKWEIVMKMLMMVIVMIAGNARMRGTVTKGRGMNSLNILSTS